MDKGTPCDGSCSQTQETDKNRTFWWSAASKWRAGAKTWQETSQACKYEPDLPRVIGPAVSRQIPFSLLWRFRNHRPHSWPLLATTGPEIFLQMKLSHVISSPIDAGSCLTLQSAWDPEGKGKTWQGKQWIDWQIYMLEMVTSLFRGLCATPEYYFSNKGDFPTWKVRGNNAWKLWSHS